ncbi:MAG TPA: hypothetical protein VNQ90_16230 [Chthoniobacteraceae bacterium]|nr:hypothetical protein [Chthoniobacteraceae bacterium]
MTPIDAKRLFLKLFIGFLGVTAFVAILSVLSGDFGEFQLKVLATTFSISAASICSMSCAAFIEKTRKRGAGVLGMVCSAVAAVMVVGGVWLDIGGEIYWKSTVSLIVAAVGFAHAFLLALPGLDARHRWAQTAADVFIAILAVQIVVAVWGEINDAGYFKLLAVVSIIVVLLTLVIPILMKIQKGSESSPKTLVLTETGDGTYRDQYGIIYQVTRMDDGDSRHPKA